MRCANASCQCQSELTIEQDGKDYCSTGCASARPGVKDACACGHEGCAGSEERAFAEGGAGAADDIPRPR